VAYAGAPLPEGKPVCWRVKVWDRKGDEGPWSQVYSFTAAKPEGTNALPVRYPLAQRHVKPARIITNSVGHVFIDFGRASYGWLELAPPYTMEKGGDFVMHIGEKAVSNMVDRAPGGTVRYAKVRGALVDPGVYRVPFIADKRNTSGAAVRLPDEVGVIMPFRYVEVETCPYPITAETIRQIAVTYPFDNDAAAFVSSSPALDRVYQLCKYSIRMTSFAGVYVDGDRERIPYEADAYINQLGHYAVDRDYTLARYSIEYLMAHPTWPTEWKQHSIMLAWTDWMYTGNTDSLARCYADLKGKKLLASWARESDGLLVSPGPSQEKDGCKDIVDWPDYERDGFEFKNVSAVVNAFHALNLRQMADIAAALGKTEDADAFRKEYARVAEAFNKVFFNAERGCYVDGEGAAHASIHANMLPLAFGLVPAAEKARVAEFVKWRGMACSVYGAQYLLDGLFEAGLADYAIGLMTRPDKRGWIHMMDLGSTVTLEAWDPVYKPNLDWNHAWGAAPANIIARHVLGVEPLEPGFAKVLLRPQPGSLEAVEGYVPTIRGRVAVGIRQTPGKAFKMTFTIPYNTTARVEVPAFGTDAIRLDGSSVAPVREGDSFVFDSVPSGAHVLTLGAATESATAHTLGWFRRLWPW
jgi:alpha-L-rhamnosidase